MYRIDELIVPRLCNACRSTLRTLGHDYIHLSRSTCTELGWTVFNMVGERALDGLVRLTHEQISAIFNPEEYK